MVYFLLPHLVYTLSVKKTVKLFLSFQINFLELSKYITDISFSSYFNSEIFPLPGSSGLNQGTELLL